MNQVKIGSFLKELRKDQGLTQEQLAEHFNVSRRTVSRWETGSNLPDLDILIEMADYYHLDLRELLDGQKRQTDTNEEISDTVRKVAEYSNEDKAKVMKRMNLLFIGGFIASIIYLILIFIDQDNNFFGGLCLGIELGMIVVGMIITSKYASKFMYKNKKVAKQPPVD